MSTILKDLLISIGPCLSTVLTEKLTQSTNLSPEAARKTISRGFDGLQKLKCIKFPRNARFIYLNEQYNSDEYWENLYDAIINSNSVYKYAIHALRQRNGLILKHHFNIACGSPILQKKHISSDAVLQNMLTDGLVKETTLDEFGKIIYLSNKDILSRIDIGNIKSRMVAESVLLKALTMWLKNLGFVSYNKVQTRDDGHNTANFGTFRWDLTGPSYLNPLRGKSIKKPGFIACDVFLGNEIDDSGISPFIHKCKTIESLKIGKCLYIYVADSYSESALKSLKEFGVIPATVNNIFGEDIAESLRYLMQILTEAAKISVDTGGVDKLLNKLGKIEGASLNIKGALFEFIVADLYRELFAPTSIRRNEVINILEKNMAIEIDIIAEKSNRSITVIECKGLGKNNEISDEYIEKWLHEKIPALRSHIIQDSRYKNHEIIFQLWNTGKISDPAKALIERVILCTKKYKIEYFDRDKIIEVASCAKNKNLISLLKNIYINSEL